MTNDERITKLEERIEKTYSIVRTVEEDMDSLKQFLEKWIASCKDE